MKLLRFKYCNARLSRVEFGEGEFSCLVEKIELEFRVDQVY